MPKNIPSTGRPYRDTYRARRALQIAIQIENKWPLYVPAVESTRLLAPDNIGISTFRMARQFLRMKRPDLVAKVLADEISLWRANEIAAKGERATCPTCKGEGYVFRMDKEPNKK